VVVLDLQIAIEPEALRDHEVVRFVSTREEAAICQSDGGDAC
jgi:hypothetical protein